MKPLLFLLLALSLRAVTLDQVVTSLEGTYIYEISNTGSMKPSFDETYVLLSDDKPFRTLEKGDVILFWATYRGELIIVCHRIWARSSGGSMVLTRGDANQSPDPWEVTQETYIGRVYGWVKRDRLKAEVIKPVRITLDRPAKAGQR